VAGAESAMPRNLWCTALPNQLVPGHPAPATRRKDRDTAMYTLLAALKEFHISPTKTTIPLHIRLLKNGNFRKSEVDINFVERLLGL